MRTMTLMMVEARPVTVMQPAMTPAIAQATATGMVLLAPAANASATVSSAILTVSASTEPNVAPSSRSLQLVLRKLMKPTTNAAAIEMAAEAAIVRTPADTIHTRSTSGMIR